MFGTWVSTSSARPFRVEFIETFLSFHRGKWIRENTGTSTNLLAVDAADKDHYWAVGEWGLILHYEQ